MVVRHALREVIGRCVYGIDLNPMAVELCKVSLWLESVEPGKPLSFLDHHIMCGNGLLGVTPRLLDEGVPDEAFVPIEGDDKPTARARKKTNANERDHRGHGFLGLVFDTGTMTAPIATEMNSIEALPSDTPMQVAEQADRYRRLQDSVEAEKARLSADAWCAAIVAVKDPAHPAITDATVRMLAEDPQGVPADALAEVTDLARQYRFLHWHLAFPQVFKVDLEHGDETGCAGGFDLVVGNPPWDTLSPDLKEFFAADNPAVRTSSKTEQEAIVVELLEIPEISDRWTRYRRDLFASVHFMKSSGRYRLFAPGNLGKGDFNVYRMFVESALQFTKPRGFVAQIVPSGFYGGANAAAIRQELFDNWQLSHVFGFINTGGNWFPAVKATTRFSLYSARNQPSTTSISVAFELHSQADLARALSMVPTIFEVDDIRASSPQALAIPEVTNAADVSLTAKLSSRWPAFGDEDAGPPIRRYQSEVHMGNDRDIFGDFTEGLPVYEGRMVAQFDHRAKAYRSGRALSAVWEELPFGSEGKAIVPQWKLPLGSIPKKVGDRIWHYRVGWCNVASHDMKRSLIAALIPPGAICGDSVSVLTFPQEFEWAYMPWLAIANSFCVDYLARQKVTLHVTMTVLDSLPIPRFKVDDPIVDRLGRLALRLSCTGPEMAGYWNAMAIRGWCEPVPPDTVPPDALISSQERADARAEIDAVVAKHVYGLTAEELSYVLDQFPVLAKRDRKAHRTYFTKDRIVQRYETV
jgi:hypothetical protein